MTLVAVIYSEHTPLIITDSLVSQENVEASGIVTPLLSEIDMRSGSTHAPVGLARKFWLLPDNSIFLYSGTIGGARRLFDELSKNFNKGDRYNNEFHAYATDYLQRITGSFSFLVAAPDESVVALFTHGTVEKELAGYGITVFLGSGKDAAENIMAKYMGATPIDQNARLLNAYNLAARLTLDYRDSGKQGSKMAASSCGGYFEVIEPSLYAISSSNLYRGTAHVFLKVTEQNIVLDEFFASSQGDKETQIISAFNLSINLTGPDFCLENSVVKNFILKDLRSGDGVNEEIKDLRLLPPVRIAILYASIVPECGLEEHRMQTHNVVAAPNAPAAMLTYTNDHLGRIDVSLFGSNGEDPVKRLAGRLRAQAVNCSRCQNSSQQKAILDIIDR